MVASKLPAAERPTDSVVLSWRYPDGTVASGHPLPATRPSTSLGCTAACTRTRPTGSRPRTSTIRWSGACGVAGLKPLRGRRSSARRGGRAPRPGARGTGAPVPQGARLPGTRATPAGRPPPVPARRGSRPLTRRAARAPARRSPGPEPRPPARRSGSGGRGRPARRRRSRPGRGPRDRSRGKDSATTAPTANAFMVWPEGKEKQSSLKKVRGRTSKCGLRRVLAGPPAMDAALQQHQDEAGDAHGHRDRGQGAVAARRAGQEQEGAGEDPEPAVAEPAGPEHPQPEPARRGPGHQAAAHQEVAVAHVRQHPAHGSVLWRAGRGGGRVRRRRRTAPPTEASKARNCWWPNRRS